MTGVLFHWLDFEFFRIWTMIFLESVANNSYVGFGWVNQSAFNPLWKPTFGVFDDYKGFIVN